MKNIVNLYFFYYNFIKEALFSVREAMKLFITSLMKKMIITELLILIVKDKKEAISYLM